MEPLGLDSIPVNVENLDVPNVDKMVLEREENNVLARYIQTSLICTVVICDQQYLLLTVRSLKCRRNLRPILSCKEKMSAICHNCDREHLGWHKDGNDLSV